MRKKSLFYRLTLGLLIGALIMPAQPARAQFGFGGLVFDVKNYALQVQRKIEEAARYVNMFDTAVRQLTTLRGVLGQVDDLVAKQRNAINTMANIGRTVRASFELKEQVQAIITTRLTMLKSIDDRLRRGIFDPDADLRDLEDYLRTSIGRSSQDSLANLERLRNMDNTLERLIYDLKNAEADKSNAEDKRKSLMDKLKVAESRPESGSDPTSIPTLIQWISDCDMLIAQYTSKIEELRGKIKEHTKKYQVLMDERIKFGEQVDETNKAWHEFNNTLDEIHRSLEKF